MANYKVYVSSTKYDLAEYRQAVRDVILKMGMFPVMYEDFSASQEEYIKTLQRRVQESDIFICVIAHLYGWIVEGSQISNIEQEYQWAREKSIPVLIYIIDDSVPWPVEKVERGEKAVLLEKFKRRFDFEAVLDRFKSPEELQFKVLLGLHTLYDRKRTREGWINMQPIFGPPPQQSQFLNDGFMIMPFRPDIDPIYTDCVRPVVEELKLTIRRGDDFFSNHSIISEIWGAIYHARFVIAECTGRNANVNYELGIAHTLGKPAIMITQNLEDIPFDLRHLRIILYENTPDGLSALKQQLRTAITRLL
jgi:hypothetical protein